MSILHMMPGHRYLRSLHGSVNWFGAAKSPAMPTPVVMPTENSAAITAAQQQAAMAAAARSGRASTILSQQDISKTDNLGN